MKVLHVIPSAFDYFDDIRAQAFGLVENLHEWGVGVHAITLQYGGQSKSKLDDTEMEVKKTAPSRNFGGITPMHDALNSFDNFDIIHLHVPFLGAAQKILRWKLHHSDKPFVITYYRPTKTSDFFSYFIRLYNTYYLPKLFSQADVLTAPSQEAVDTLPKRFQERFFVVDATSNFFGFDLRSRPEGQGLKAFERLAFKYSMLYNDMVTNTISTYNS